VDNAPVLKTWKFTAFIDSKETIEKRINKLDSPFIIKDINLKENQVQFIPINLERDSKKQTIQIHLKNYTIYCSNKTLIQAIFFILEKLSVNTVLYGPIHLVQLSQCHEQEVVLIHLQDLQEYPGRYNLKKLKTL
jgi:hypothetical protein